MTGSLSQQEFLDRSEKIRKGRFDYSKSVFKGVDKAIVVSCKIHGDITTTPYLHWTNKWACKGCEKDGRDLVREKNFKKELFLSNKYFREGTYKFIRFDEKNSRIGYFESEYAVHKCYLHSVTIGDQKLTANSVSDVNLYYTKMLLDKNEGFRKKLFSLDGTIKTQKAPLTITFNSGKKVVTCLNSLLLGCFSKEPIPIKEKGEKYDRVAVFTERILRKIEEVRTDFYNTDYSLFKYEFARVPAKFKCKKHSLIYEQRISHHINNVQACPECKGFKMCGVYTEKSIIKGLNSVKGSMYVVRLYDDKESFFKVGITRRALDKRMKEFREYGFTVEVIYDYEDYLSNVFQREQEILNLFKDYKYEPLSKFGGYTECFTEDVWVMFYNWNCEEEAYKKESDRMQCEENGIDYEQQLYSK